MKRLAAIVKENKMLRNQNIEIKDKLVHSKRRINQLLDYSQKTEGDIATMREDLIRLSRR